MSILAKHLRRKKGESYLAYAHRLIHKHKIAPEKISYMWVISRPEIEEVQKKILYPIRFYTTEI